MGGGTGGPHFIRPLSESFSHYFSSPSPPSNVSISAAQDCSQIKPDRVFPLSQEQRDTVQFSHLPPLVVFWLLVFVS